MFPLPGVATGAVPTELKLAAALGPANADCPEVTVFCMNRI